jgi:hypothetical protein
VRMGESEKGNNEKERVVERQRMRNEENDK